MNKIKYAIIAGLLLLIPASVSANVIEGTDFEDGSLTSWNIGSQIGSLTNGTITQNGTGVTLIDGAVSFSAPSHGGAGSPTLPDGSVNPYYQPPVEPAVWSFSPYGSKAIALQPNGQSTFDQTSVELGLSTDEVTELKSLLSAQASASGYGSGNPTDAAWITRNVTLSAGIVYTMSWNYIGTDYVPFNDGSITSLVGLGDVSNSAVTVNNGNKSYALLGFTNPGTGDYSTGTFGSTGWQVSTYEVSVTGEYLLGFAVFNLDDTGLSPVLLVDSQPGSTIKNDEPFGAVAPNNPDAPTIAPTTTEQTTTTEAVTTTEPPTTEPPATEPPATEPPDTTSPETTTTEAPPREEITYTPPVITTDPTITTTTLIETTTTTEVMTVPDDSIPVMDEVIELPKTGYELNILIGAAIITISGLFIWVGRSTASDYVRRKI